MLEGLHGQPFWAASIKSMSRCLLVCRINSKGLGRLGPFPRQLEIQLTPSWIVRQVSHPKAVLRVVLIQLLQRRDHRHRLFCWTRAHPPKVASQDTRFCLGPLAGS